MKTILRLLIVSTFACGFLQSRACINPDTAVTIIVNYDTNNASPCPEIDQVEMRFTNLRLMSESPNKFCACGVASWASIFSELQYIAFVDSGTNNPYLGFEAFTESLASSASWQAESSGSGDWTGLIAQVLNAGLSSDDPVELVIRATAPPGTGAPVDSLCFQNGLVSLLDQSSLGTDEWDPVANDLVGSHRAVRSFDENLPGNSVTYNMVTEAYLQQLDDDILNNIPIGIGSVKVFKTSELTVFPNPVTNRSLTLELSLTRAHQVSIELIDLYGRTIQDVFVNQTMRGNQSMTLPIASSDFAAGVYFVRVRVDSEVLVQKFTVQ